MLMSLEEVTAAPICLHVLFGSAVGITSMTHRSLEAEKRHVC